MFHDEVYDVWIIARKIKLINDRLLLILICLKTQFLLYVQMKISLIQIIIEVLCFTISSNSPSYCVKNLQHIHINNYCKNVNSSK